MSKQIYAGQGRVHNIFRTDPETNEVEFTTCNYEDWPRYRDEGWQRVLGIDAEADADDAEAEADQLEAEADELESHKS